MISRVFAGILCFIPAKPIKPKLDEKITPMLNSIKMSLAELMPEQRETPKAFLKKCVKCGKEIPIASEECPHCGAKQPQRAKL
jgi:rRNA maturation endonuclease Nob1